MTSVFGDGICHCRQGSELFVTSLHDEEVAKEIFAHDPPLITLDEVQTQVVDIFSRNRQMTRAWQNHHGRHSAACYETPMEVGPVESDEVGAFKAKVNHLETQAATATPPPAAPSVYEMKALKRL